jgi:hypothetical protein
MVNIHFTSMMFKHGTLSTIDRVKDSDLHRHGTITHHRDRIVIQVKQRIQNG